MSQLDKRLDEILATYGNYKTVKKDWVESEHDEPFEITGGNKLLLDKAKQAIKQLMVDEFEKMIGEYRDDTDSQIPYPEYDDEIISVGYNNAKYELRQKLKEWKGGV